MPIEEYTLDTSALLTLRDNEEGADIVAQILRKATKEEAKAYVSFMSYMEYYYCIWRDEGRESAQDAFFQLKSLPLIRINLSEELLEKAAEIKALYPLSVADSWIIATAVLTGSHLVHKDPEFEKVKEVVYLATLPYKN